MKIAHISDLHLNTFYRESYLTEVDHLLQYCAEKQYDHLIITGDLTDNATEGDYKIIRKLLLKYDYLRSDRLSVVIGNHDIYGGVQKAEEIFSFPDKCSNIDYNLRVSSFNNFFKESFEDTVYLSENNIYPYAKIIKDILVIGLNSNALYSKVNNPFASNGEINLDQFSKLVDILDKYGRNVKHRIILIHHHFNKIKSVNRFSSAGLWQNIEKQTMKLRKKKRLINLFETYKVNLVLHGHLHESGVYQRGKINFANAGGTIKSCKKNKIILNQLIIEDNIKVMLKEINKEPVEHLNLMTAETEQDLLTNFSFQ